MKILELSSAFPPSRGGVEMTVSELSMRLAARGHSVTVITSTRGASSRPREEYVGKVKVIRMPERLHLFEAPIIPQIALRALFYDFDVLHVHGMSPTISDLGVLVGKIRKKPVVVTYHNDAESTLDWGIANLAARLYARFCLPILKLADSIVCATRSYAATSLVLRHLHGRFEVIPLGVDVTRFAGTGSRQIANETKEVLFVGQLKDYKGVTFLIEAVGKLRRAGIDVALTIAGDGPSYPRLKAMTKTLGMTDSVKFRGNVDESTLVSLYDSCDLVVLPSVSRREAFGLVQLEALAAGRAVVASDIPGVGDVTRMIGGYLAQPNDADSLALQLAKALGTNHDSMKLKKTAAGMSWEVVTTEYEELFISLLKNAPQSIPQDSRAAESEVPSEKDECVPREFVNSPIVARTAKDQSRHGRFLAGNSLPGCLRKGIATLTTTFKNLFSFIAAGLAAVFGGGAIIMGMLSATADPLSADPSASIGEFAWVFFLFAVLLGFLSFLLKSR